MDALVIAAFPALDELLSAGAMFPGFDIVPLTADPQTACDIEIRPRGRPTFYRCILSGGIQAWRTLQQADRQSRPIAAKAGLIASDELIAFGM
jgi:hypothetical protein